MALRALMINKQLREKRKTLEDLKKAAEELEQRKADLAQAIEEANTDEDRSAVEEEVEAFEKDEKENGEQIAELEDDIRALETELKEVETEDEPEETPEEEQRKENNTMSKRKNFFGMTMQERDQFIAREDVQKFLGEIRAAMKEKRAITNAGLLIPEVVIGLLRENIIDYSKLYKHVFVRRVPGTGRMIIQGSIPEAVWTEACANLNELNLSFSKVEVDGYKVGGYFRICNATLEDSDIDLAADLLEILGQAIGYALDKAILYGTGTKMPVGIVTALAAVTGTPNIVSHAATVVDMALIKALVGDAGKIKSNYSRGEKVWVMNETTYSTLIANALAVNAAGAIVSGVNGQMPVIGGIIEVLNFVPNNVIIGGYFDLYLLAERAGTTINTSEHAFWIEDETGFKGTARYDGKVLDANAFVVIGINGATPAAISFAQDTANPEG